MASATTNTDIPAPDPVLPERVKEHILGGRREHLARLWDLLRIPSISSRASASGDCERAAAWVRDRLAAMGFAAEIVPADGPPNVLASLAVDGRAPTLLLYGHYDVQPPEPVEQWRSDPFEPAVRNGCVYARGANDDKGQLFAQLLALEAWRACGWPRLNVKALIEGQEEIGSPGLEKFVAANADRLAADACVISDSEFFAPGLPGITYSLRGLAYFELLLRGPQSDVHSGLHGGALTNPADALAAMLAGLRDRDGRITLDGFYDDVLALEADERGEWAQLPFDEDAYARSLGLPGAAALGGGERGYSVLERRWARPTLDCNGLFGGHQGQGAKTIIPASAGAKISCRLVPNQDPRKVEDAMRRHIAARTPPGVVAELNVLSSSRPVMLRRNSPAMTCARRAYAEGFGREPVLIRCGASVPVTEMFQRLLGLDAVLMGFGLPDDNLHAPNERFNLDQLWRGAITAASFIGRLAAR